MHANTKVFLTWSLKQQLFALFYYLLIKLVSGCSISLLQHHKKRKNHFDQLKSVRENETNWFHFALNLWPPAKVKFTESGIKWL